jgi:hypothetical protein
MQLCSTWDNDDPRPPTSRPRISDHTFRTTGITTYLKKKGTLEHAQTLPTIRRRTRPRV